MRTLIHRGREIRAWNRKNNREWSCRRLGNVIGADRSVRTSKTRRMNFPPSASSPLCAWEKGDFYVNVFPYHHRRAFATPSLHHVALSRGCPQRGLIYSRRFISGGVRYADARFALWFNSPSFATLHFVTRNMNIWRRRASGLVEFLKTEIKMRIREGDRRGVCELFARSANSARCNEWKFFQIRRSLRNVWNFQRDGGNANRECLKFRRVTLRAKSFLGFSSGLANACNGIVSKGH